MKHILIVAALSKELRVAKNHFKLTAYKDVTVSFIESGIWTHKTILRLTRELSSSRYDCIINIWVCWYTESQLKCIQVVRSVHNASQKEILTPVFFQFAPLTSILCSDTVIDSPELLEDLEYVDMESYAIEMVCEEFKIPRILLKVPVDKLWEETRNFNYSHALDLLEKNIDFKSLMNDVIQYLDSLPRKQNYDIYLDHYALTFSEKIIMQKYIAAYESLLWNFHSFFQENKALKKDVFLKKLSGQLSNYHQ